MRQFEALMNGPGKYDHLLTAAREAAGATGAVLMILDGDMGSGFSIQAPVETYGHLPAVLRMIADQVEADNILRRRDVDA